MFSGLHRDQVQEAAYLEAEMRVEKDQSALPSCSRAM